MACLPFACLSIPFLLLSFLLQLLQDQLGTVRFDPYRPFFMLLFSQSRASLTAIPLTTPLFGYPNRNWRDASARGGLPANALKLADLVHWLQVRKVGMAVVALLGFSWATHSHPSLVVWKHVHVVVRKSLVQASFASFICMVTNMRETLKTLFCLSFVQVAYQSTTSGKFQDAVEKFRAILLRIPLLVVDTKSQIAEVSAEDKGEAWWWCYKYSELYSSPCLHGK